MILMPTPISNDWYFWYHWNSFWLWSTRTIGTLRPHWFLTQLHRGVCTPHCYRSGINWNWREKNFGTKFTSPSTYSLFFSLKIHHLHSPSIFLTHSLYYKQFWLTLSRLLNTLGLSKILQIFFSHDINLYMETYNCTKLLLILSCTS